MKNLSINDLLSIIKGNPQSMYENMIKTNPQFAQFAKDNEGKSAEEIAKSYNIDPALLQLFNLK